MLKNYFKELPRDLTVFGGFYFLLVLSLILISLKSYDLFYKILFGVVSTYVIAFIIRIFYFKDRPNKEQYTNLITKIDASSFPSVHSARAVFTALVLSSFFANNYLTAIFIIVALLTCYSRILIKKHFLIDVIAGIILGIILYVISLRLI